MTPSEAMPTNRPSAMNAWNMRLNALFCATLSSISFLIESACTPWSVQRRLDLLRGGLLALTPCLQRT